MQRRQDGRHARRGTLRRNIVPRRAKEDHMNAPLIVVVEDEPTILMLIDALLTEAGYATLLITQGKDAHLQIRQAQPAAVVLDLHLEHPQAGEMVLGLLEVDPQTQHIPVVICSAYLGLPDHRAYLLREKGYHLLEKPFDPHELVSHVARCLTARQEC